ncbi:MAG: isoprenylcysteine carboxylmethyltransferase family protein [Bacteroidetes bacterium]|jgi:protein-S-isoprenylcysteine O-methyltransferase Ste14|nr:isoprenylcysteine carboxylmethyltransferase family protein [Bacteroidota bacterium]
MKSKVLAYFFVFVQFSMLLFLLASGPWLANSNVGILVEVAGLFIGIIAILNMQIGNFNVAPLPKAGGVLVTNGIYQYIRHPMYLAQLLALLPLVVESFTNFRMIGWSLLLVNLIFKLYFEERNLRSQFPDYASYMKTSWRLIPFIF